jgi:hypothetical protein
MRSIIICLFASFLAVHAIEMRVSRMFNNFFLEDPYINPWLGEMMFEAADKISEVGSTSTSRRGSDEKKVKTVSLKNVKAPEKDKKIGMYSEPMKSLFHAIGLTFCFFHSCIYCRYHR